LASSEDIAEFYPGGRTSQLDPASRLRGCASASPS
jgi:hypothetical protein